MRGLHETHRMAYTLETVWTSTSDHTKTQPSSAKLADQFPSRGGDDRLPRLLGSAPSLADSQSRGPDDVMLLCC